MPEMLPPLCAIAVGCVWLCQPSVAEFSLISEGPLSVGEQSLGSLFSVGPEGKGPTVACILLVRPEASSLVHFILVGNVKLGHQFGAASVGFSQYQTATQHSN